MVSMIFGRKSVIAGLALCLYGGSLASSAQTSETPGTVRHVQMSREHSASTLTRDDGKEVVAVALDERVRMGRRDCSHLVHAIYEQAGFAYPYANSSDLYRGTDDFRR